MAEKEVTLFIIDVSDSMHKACANRQENALEWCLSYVWDKVGIKIMAARKTDYVAVIVVGSDVTDHMIAEGNDYDHIRIILPFPRRGSDEFKSYAFDRSHVRLIKSELKIGSQDQGDLVSALIIGVQMIGEFCKELKFKKNLILLTRGELTSDFSDIELIAQQIQSQAISVSVLGIDFDDAEIGFKEEDKSAVKLANEASFRSFCDACNGTYATFLEVYESMQVPRIKPVKPVTTFRGSLTIGDETHYKNTVQIPVERYPRTKQARAPGATKFSEASEQQTMVAQASQLHRRDGNYQADIPASTHQVLPARSYKLKDGTEVEDKNLLERGYNYGRTIVPMSRADEEFLKFKTQPGLQVLGFLEAEAVPHYLLMSDVSVIIPQRANDSAALALSSFIHALYESDTYALARLVKKENTAPVMVLLAPNIEPDFESLSEAQLPYNEDVRQYKFAPLDKILGPHGKYLKSHRYLPTAELNAAMADVVDNMSLDELDEQAGIVTDTLRPEDTYNPGIHRVMQAILFRAFNDHSRDMPPPSSKLLLPSKIPADITENDTYQKSLAKLIETAQVKVVPPKSLYQRARGAKEEAKTGLDIEGLLDASVEDADTIKEEKHSIMRTPHASGIGRQHPVKDFEGMMQHDALIDEAFQKVQSVIEETLQYSLGDQNYQLSRDLLLVFRKHALEQEEGDMFNEFLSNLKVKMTEQNRGDFSKSLEGLIDPI